MFLVGLFRCLSALRRSLKRILVRMCLSTPMYVRICTYLYVYVSLYVGMYMYVCVFESMCLCLCVCRRAFACMYVCLCLNVYKYVCIGVWVSVWNGEEGIFKCDRVRRELLHVQSALENAPSLISGCHLLVDMKWEKRRVISTRLCLSLQFTRSWTLGSERTLNL